MGDCVQIKLPAGGQNFQVAPELCIETRLSIEQHQLFSIADFGSKNGSKYRPLSYSITVAGKHYCSRFHQQEHIVRQTCMFESKTENVVEGKCEALDNIVKDAWL